MINKNKFVLFLLFLLIIAIPISFASDIDVNETGEIIQETIDESDNVSASSDDYEIVGAGDVYFDASVSSGGDGSQSRPYNTVTSSYLGTTNHFASGTYKISGSLSSYSYEGKTFVGDERDNTILHYVGSDTFMTTSYDLTFTGITLKGCSIVSTGGTLTANNVIFDSGVAPEETESDNYKYGNSYGGAIKQTTSSGFDWGSIFGGGSSSTSQIIINSCIFRNNCAAYGGAVYSEKGTVTITNSRFENNHAENGGGAIFASDGASLTVNNCEFINDYSHYDAGGAIYLFNATEASVNNSRFVNCHAAIGGAVASLITPLTISNSNFNTNKANWTGGAVFSMYGRLTVSCSDFYGNGAYLGGGIYADNLTYFEVNGGIFQENIADGSAGAIFSFTNMENRISNPTYILNEASQFNDLYQTDVINLIIGSDDYEMIQYLSSYNGVLPSKYDLRIVNGVTPVKDQGQSGNCWAFATMATLESAILKATGKQVILSEGNLKNLANLYSDIGWRYETNNGGMYPFAFGYLTSWAGPVLNSLDPTDDWDVVAPILNSAVHVQNLLFLQRTLYTDNDAIKKAIMDYGAVCSEIYWSSSYLNGNNYYYSGSETRNHAVSVVGWDDAKSVSGAPGVGAWIVKNSYGTHRGDGGYYYVSYYDKSLFRVYDESYNSFAVIFNDTIRFNKNYQYDAAFTDYFMTSSMSKVMWYKNTFTSSGNDILSAFSTYFRKVTTWEAQIFINDELKLTQTGKSNPGYYTINLNEEIPLKLGDSFTISLKIQCSSSADIPISESGNPYTLVKQYFKPGVSFFSYDGQDWTDFYGYKASFGSGNNAHNYYNQAACIKAFTREGPKEFLNTTIEIVSVNSTNVEVAVKDQRGGKVNMGTVEFVIDGFRYSVDVSGSKAILNIYLRAGNHSIGAKYVANEYYNGSSVFENVSLSKEDPQINIMADGISYGNDLHVRVLITNAVGDEVNLPVAVDVGGKTYFQNDFNVSDLAANLYTIRVQTGETEDFNAKKDTRLVLVSQAIPTLSLEIADTYIAQNINIEATLSNNITGTVNVNVGEDTYQISVLNGRGNISIANDFNAGLIVAYGEFVGNVNYSPVQSEKTFIVKKYAPDLSVFSEDIIEGQDAIIIVYLDSDIGDNLSLRINSKSYSSKPLNGEAIFNVTNLTLGKYGYAVIFDGNSKYEKSTKSGSLEVLEKLKITPAFNVSDYSKDDYVVINVELNGDAAGNVELDFDSLIFNKAIADGKVSFKINDLENKVYNYTVTFSGDMQYKSCRVKKSVVVIDSSKVTPDISLIAEDIVEGQNAVFELVLSEDINEMIHLSIDSREYSARPINGKAIFNISDLKVNEYVYGITFYGNDKYDSFNLNGILRVSKKSKMIPVLEITSEINGKNAIINVEVKNAAGNVVLETYAMTLAHSLINGKVSFSLNNLTKGTYGCNVTYGGDLNYESAVKRYVFEIIGESTILAGDMKRSYYSGYDFEAIFMDKSGNLLNNKTVTFIVNGNEYNIRTNAYGVARLNSKYSPGTYDVTAINPDSSEVLIKRMVIVERITGNKDIVTDYSLKSTFKVRIYGDNGNAVGSGERVSFKINGLTSVVETDGKGYASVNLNLKPGTYTITSEYRGVKVSNKVVVKQILKAKNAKFKKSKKVKKFTATLKTSKGRAFSGKKITLKINGRTYIAKTNKKGVATFKIKNLKKAGKFRATVSYLHTSVKRTVVVRV